LRDRSYTHTYTNTNAHTEWYTHTGACIMYTYMIFIRFDEILAFVDNPARTAR